MKISKNKKPQVIAFTGYTDAPPEIEKELEGAKRVKDFLPLPEDITMKTVPEKERKRTLKAWKRYCIKDHELGHRKRLSETLMEPVRRFDTSIILPERVYLWLRSKKNKAGFIRSVMIKSYEKATR